MFNIEIKISNVSEKERDVIHVGMTVNVEIDVKNHAHILLPIQGLSKQCFKKNGQSLVTILDPKTGEKRHSRRPRRDTHIDGDNYS